MFTSFLATQACTIPRDISHISIFLSTTELPPIIQYIRQQENLMGHRLCASLVNSDFTQVHFNCMQKLVKYLVQTQVRIIMDSPKRQKLQIINNNRRESCSLRGNNTFTCVNNSMQLQQQGSAFSCVSIICHLYILMHCIRHLW